MFLYNLEPVKRSRIVSYCYQNWKVIYYSIEPEDVVSLGSQRLLFDDKSMICASSRELTFEQRVLKRLMDIIVSAIGLVIASPIMLVTALAIKLEDHGPVFYRQKRATYAGRIFEVYKFRSMRVNAAEDSAWSTNSDPRKTRFGSIIRKFSLDELPQFFNVLKGDMSLVGPRPEIPFHVEHFKEEIPRYLVRQQVRPGLTGWAQINGLRGDTDIAERIRYDIWYIENWTVALDIKILFRTVFGGKMVNDEKIQ